VAGINTYAYASLNPIRYSDRTGENPFSLLSGFYGLISGGVGGYISSGGDWRGGLYGALAGGFVGLINPFASNAVGIAAGAALASLGGQAAGLASSKCKDPLDIRNYSMGAIAGAGLGGPIGAGIGRAGGALIDPIRRNIIGHSLSASVISRANQKIVGSLLEGTIVGPSEYVGSKLLPASQTANQCSCSYTD
jgi:hypothetical protein